MAWLGTYAFRRKITNDNTNIDSDLLFFPGIIVLGTSVGQSAQDITNVFDEVGANYLKIAITKSDGITQIYGDVEQWDSGAEKAVIHVAKSDLTFTSASVTEFYIYFDSAQADNTTFIGLSGGTAAQSVYDSDFESMHHMNQDPSGGAGSILDSTSNNNDGTPVGSMISGDLVDATPFGKGIDFNGSQAIGLGDILDSIFAGSTATFTVVVAFKTTVIGNQVFLGKYNAGTDDRGLLISSLNESFHRVYLHYEDKAASDRRSIAGSSTISTGTEYVAVFTYDATQGSGNDGEDRVTHRVNNVIQTKTLFFESGSVSDIEDNAAHLSIGAILDTAGANPSSGFTGIIREISISEGVRSSAWQKATYYALIDDLVTFGATENFSPAPAIEAQPIITITT